MGGVGLWGIGSIDGRLRLCGGDDEVIVAMVVYQENE
jgi:hypothetical protein